MDDDSDELLRLVAQQVELANRLKARIRELEDERSAPLAIVSTALRLPGGLTTPEAYWQFLLGDRDVEPRIPDVAAFDPAFFGMSQREAEHTDPRQRLLLHTAWEAFERAGLAVRRHDRLNAGVFIGITADEYSERLQPADRIRGDAAGRISQQIGLTGPAVSVDTACSSSLVALHIAAQALRRGECRYALVGSASLLFSPGQTDDLAPDGRCKPFTASADGHARGEGVGVVLVMRLRDAEQEGRPIQAILRGSAVLHAGSRGSANADTVRASLDDACAAQQEVISAALTDAAIAAHEIGVVETHATGSPLGDPIEVAALDEVIGAAAPQRPVRALLSTLKPRLGHLDGAAGIAALIKVVLMLQHGVVPAAVPLEAGALTEYVPWDHVHVLVPRVHSPWPIEYDRRVAGVSSFGENGTNAHAILEAYVPTPTQLTPLTPPQQANPRPHLITLSARNATSLTEMVVALSSYLVGTPPEKLASVAHTLHVGRTPFEHRVCVVGASGSDLAENLAVAVGHSINIDRAKSKAVTGTTQTTIILRVGSGVVRLCGAINALIAAYPLLAPIVGASDLPPAERLKRLMLHFGLRVKSERLGRASGAAAAEIAWSDQVLPLITDDTDETPTHLLHILAALFTAGADLRLDALRQPGARIVDDLPTYSFRKKRCWVDKSTDTADDQTPAAVAASAHEPDQRLIRDFLFSELMNVVPARNAFDPTLTFIELGGDSFAAMQLTVSIEERYGVEIPLDEFNGDLQASLLIERLTRRIAQVMDWTTQGVAREDDDPCPPSYPDVSCPPPSTQTSYAPSSTGSSLA